MPQLIGMPMSFLDWIDTYRVFHTKKSKDDTGNATVPSGETTPRQENNGPDPTFAEKAEVDNSKIRLLRPRIFAMALIVSIGGLIFGYDVRELRGSSRCLEAAVADLCRPVKSPAFLRWTTFLPGLEMSQVPP